MVLFQKSTTIKLLRTSPKGFTLIELMVVIAIIGVVFSIIITSAALVRKNSQDAQRQSDLRSIQSALEQYNADQTFYPTTSSMGTLATTLNQLDNTVGNPSPPSSKRIYLGTIPKDPTGGTYAYYAVSVDASNNAIVDNTCNNITSGLSVGTSPVFCTKYCLYAKLSTLPSGYSLPVQCPAQSGYNYAVYPL